TTRPRDFFAILSGFETTLLKCSDLSLEVFFKNRYECVRSWCSKLSAHTLPTHSFPIGLNDGVCRYWNVWKAFRFSPPKWHVFNLFSFPRARLQIWSPSKNLVLGGAAHCCGGVLHLVSRIWIVMHR
ncbi:unnamed protein product, partial [Hapterophycus canaliculatus]